MATVKLQPSGKVVIKDGKVACGCCEVGCCMYEAQALADALYTADDLPDDVIVNGTSLPRSGTTYGNTTSGVIFEENVWAKYTSGVRSSRPCLIQGGDEDQFADTYTISGLVGGWETYDVYSESTLLIRNDLCKWVGDWYTISVSDGVSSGTCEIQLNLSYGTFLELTDLWVVNFYVRNWNVNYYEGGSVPEPPYQVFKYKSSTTNGGAGISSPIGDYYQGDGFGQWTIS